MRQLFHITVTIPHEPYPEIRTYTAFGKRAADKLHRNLKAQWGKRCGVPVPQGPEVRQPVC